MSGEETWRFAARCVGAQVKAIRIERGLRQCDLADAVGTARSTVSRLEAGRHCPTLVTVFEYAVALKCLPSDLVAGMDWEDGE